MPDVAITCPSCCKTITVSEFVDLSQLVCRSCGSSFSPAAGESQEAPEDDAQDVQDVQSARDPVVTITPSPTVVVIAKVKPGPRRMFRWTYQLKCWIVFAGVAIVSLLLRYGGLLGSDTLDVLIEYGPIIVLALHLYVTFSAFRESVLAGILCLLVPFYSLYYAFWTFEDYMFRAVFAGILVGLGFDTLIVFRDNADKILPSIDEFLNRGM